MDMAIDAKKTLQKLRGEETKRGKITLYLDREIYELFKKQCAEIAPSRVINQLMLEFINSTKRHKK